MCPFCESVLPPCYPQESWNTPSVVVSPELEQMIRDELREPVAEIVRRIVPELVAEALNDAPATMTRSGHGPLASWGAPRP